MKLNAEKEAVTYALLLPGYNYCTRIIIVISAEEVVFYLSLIFCTCSPEVQDTFVVFSGDKKNQAY